MPNKRTPAPAKAAIAAMEQANATIDDKLRGLFECFMEAAMPGEKMFLQDVFTNHECIYRTVDPRHIAIAGAFQCSLTNSDELTTVNLEHYRDLRAFWGRFHTKEPNLETEFLQFAESADEKRKAVLRRALALGSFDTEHFVGTLVNVVNAHHGDYQPFEALILSLLSNYSAGQDTPEHARRTMEQFEEAFENVVDIARETLKRYPDAVKATPPEAS